MIHIRNIWAFLLVILFGVILFVSVYFLGNSGYFLSGVILLVSVLIERKLKDKRIATEKERIHQEYINRIAAGDYQTLYEYKQFVGLWLEQKGYMDIQVTKRSGENEADIICMDNQGNRIAVLCKLYRKPVGYRLVEEPVGYRAVVEARVAMFSYKCDKAMVVTNNSYTKQAIEEANRTGVKLWEGICQLPRLPRS